ncbi:asparagine synthetase domain-containing protein CG17486 isoform X2 [Helicoverpa armigera]|uniref:asparagine synthetase domain-containing protein CG17486 isoform X2 n=1 Tax=Helicoverpa armigera TaxID=29058 RepID=UPI0030839BD0
MCGIFCEICFCENQQIKDAQVMQRIKNRGPDCVRSVEMSLGDGLTAFFCGAVLWMQGRELTPQPVENDQGVLLYNGDIFDDSWPCDVSDTTVIMEMLTKAEKPTDEFIVQQLKLLKGPFAIIYYEKRNNKLYFLRDRIGRSSLLFHKSDNTIVIGNTLGRKYDCVEVPATHIQILNLRTNTVKLCPWDEELHTSKELTINDWTEQLRKQQSLPDDEFSFEYTEKELTKYDEVVAFIESTAREIKCKSTLMKKLLENTIIKNTVVKVTKLLEISINLRLNRQPNKCKKCLNNTIHSCSHCTVGILFSGGLDCTILAVLADKYLPREQTIDLINVAFKKDHKSTFDVPDRITGKQSLQELQKLCPTRKWVFREVNIPKEEVEKYQENVIGDLIYPRKTILDESLGTALWFAARGQSSLESSSCRVLLVGSGADELFGGYTRHKNAFKRNGWQGLNKELQLDWKRISFRNLARDNRVICDHGRQPRMPYLDEDFTSYILQLKPWLRCFPSEDLGIGIGDKLMLRLVAFNLGLTEAVILPKRALQFGSRIANKKEKGSDISKTFFKNIPLTT